MARTNKNKRMPFCGNPQTELKAKKMRAEICYRLVSGRLSYDQSLVGKRPGYCKRIFQYFVKTHYLT